jgi:isopropylmalate/homocitrate/citramalate synthase
LFSIGCDEVSIADTIGQASPDETDRLLEEALSRLAAGRIALHFHDTTGQAIDNVRRGWTAGISRFDASVGGLGGCPFAPGAPGNVSTERLADLFAAEGVATGIEISLLRDTGAWIREVVNQGSHARH